MPKTWIAVALVAIGTSTPAYAAEYLTSVTSEVFQAQGSPREIAARASTCIAVHLSSGSSDDPLVISTDLDGGMIVARNSIEYGSLPRWKIRSRFTFEAREGRFRIEQTSLERVNTNMLTGEDAWGRIGKWTGSRWKEVQKKFEESANTVAQCVINGSVRQDW